MTSQDGARPALFQNCCVVLCIVCFVSFYVLFVCKCVLLPPGDNPIAVNKCIKYQKHVVGNVSFIPKSAFDATAAKEGFWDKIMFSKFGFVLTNVYWLHIVLSLTVLSSNKRQELLEVASNDVIPGKAVTHHVLAHHLHASPKQDSWGDPIVRRQSEAISADRGGWTTRPTPINQRSVYAASIQFLTASCKFYRRIIIIIIQGLPTFPAATPTSISEWTRLFQPHVPIVSPWRPSHNLWKFVNYSVTSWMYFTHYPRPTCSLTLQYVALPFKENVNKHFIQRIHTAATKIVFERLLKQNISL